MQDQIPPEQLVTSRTYARPLAPFLNIVLSKIQSELCLANAETIAHIFDQRRRLAQFLHQLLRELRAYQERVDAVLGPSWVVNECLSEDVLFDGGHILRCLSTDDSPDVVAYPSVRVRPTIYMRASKWLSDRTGFPSLHRSELAQRKDGVILKPFVPRGQVLDRTAASRSSGALIALAQYLAMTDCHASNVVFHEDTPFLIDDESVMQFGSDPSTVDGRSTIRGTRLIPDRHLSRNECGLADLLRTGIDLPALAHGYMTACKVILANRSSFVEVVMEACDAYPWLRHYRASSSFYRSLKQVLGLALFHDSTELDILSELRARYRLPGVPNSEYRGHVDHEIRRLRNGHSPHWVINARDGKISEAAGDQHVDAISPPKQRWLDHINGMDRQNIERDSAWLTVQIARASHRHRFPGLGR